MSDPDPPNSAPPSPGPRRRALRAALIAGAGLGVGTGFAVLTLWLLAPALLKVEAVRARLVAEATSRLPARVEAQGVEVSVWPLPRLTLRGVRAGAPGGAVAEARVVVVTADPRSLLSPRLRVRSLSIEDLRAHVPLAAEEFPDVFSRMALEREEEKLFRWWSTVRPRLPDRLAVSVRRGRLDLAGPRGRRRWVDRVDASLDLSTDSLSVQASATASFAERLVLRATLSPPRHAGTARLDATRLNLDDLSPRGVSRVRGTTWSGDARIAEAGRGDWRLEVSASTPRLAVVRGPRRLELSGVRVQATAEASGPRWRVAVQDASADRPRLALSGSLSWDPSAPRADLTLRVPDLDLGPAREAALALAADAALVRRVCDLFRGGRVSELTVASRAPTPAGLGGLAGLSLRGRVEAGSLHIPGADLPVTAAAGEVALAGGVLTGRRLSGRTGTSSAWDGRLRMGFGGPGTPFRFEGKVSADLAELRRRLPGWLPAGRLRDELRLVDAAEGRATGRLVLGERLGSLTASVRVQALDVAGRYRRVPFPIRLRGALDARPGRVAVAGLSGRVGRSTLSNVSGEVTLSGEPRLRIASGGGVLDTAELYPWLLTAPAARRTLRDFGPPEGHLSVTSLTLDGPTRIPGRWTVRARGGVDGLSLRSLWFPGRLSLQAGEWAWSEGALTWSEVRTALLDARATTSGRIGGLRGGPREVAATVDGDFGPAAAAWVAAEASLPRAIKVARAVAVRRGRLERTPSGVSFQGELAPAGGPIIDLEVRRAEGLVEVPRLTVRDARSNARLSLSATPEAWDVSFAGRLHADTLDALVDRTRLGFEEAQGDFRARLDPDAPRASSARGRLRLTGARLLLGGDTALSLDEATVTGSGQAVEIDGATGSLGPVRFSVAGRVEAGPDAYRPDLRVKVGAVDARALERYLGPTPPDPGRRPLLDRLRALPIDGQADFDVAALRYGRHEWAPVRGRATLSRGVLSANVRQATVCGVSTPARVEVGPSGVRVEVDAAAQGPNLDVPLACLWNRGGLATGRFRFSAAAKAAGQPGTLLRASTGDVTFAATDGRVFRFGLLAKIFAVLNVTEVFRGRLPDLFREGLGYRSVHADAALEQGSLVFRQARLDGHSETIFWEGRVDLATRKVDLTVLVAPFKTIDDILRRIPVIGYLLGGRLVAIPLRVQGNMDDPTVVPLHPADIGAGLLGVVERTLKLPFHLIQPLLPPQDKAPPAH